MDTPSAPSFRLNTKSWHETCRTAHFSVRPRRSHFSVPTAVQLRRRFERGEKAIITAWDFLLHFPCPLQRLGSGSGKAIKNRAFGLIRKPDPAHRNGTRRLLEGSDRILT